MKKIIFAFALVGFLFTSCDLDEEGVDFVLINGVYWSIFNIDFHGQKSS
jgi:hypothetical protein